MSDKCRPPDHDVGVSVQKIREWDKYPFQKHPTDAGHDLYVSVICHIDSQNEELVAYPSCDSYELAPLERVACKLGIKTGIPPGYFFMVVPRSGLALWKGLSIVNSPGIIDSDYRGEWIANVVNLSNEPVTISVGMRICQAILVKKVDMEFLEGGHIGDTKRGKGGFGSTGVK